MNAGLGTETGGAEPTTLARFTPPTPEELAALFPQFEILSFIGQGGMGAVYKARQKQLDRIVALKILPPSIGQDPAFAERFAREARAMAKLNHPGIVTIYDFGQAQGGAGQMLARLYYFIMEFVDGVSLRQLLQAGRVAPREALAIVPQICDALQYAHDQGIIHRDIKPENILLDRLGRVKVADFGLAKLVAPGSDVIEASKASLYIEGLTAVGKIMGTPNYMAPEQVERPADVDHRADLYALGVVFYQMLTGELPAKRIEPPSRKVQLDVRLDEVVLQALEKNPARRYQQASEVKTALENISGKSGETSQPSAPAAPRPKSRAESTNPGPAAVRGQRTWLYAFAAGILAVLLVEFAASALMMEAGPKALVGLPAGGVALVILMVAPKRWLGGFLACITFAFFLWLAVAALMVGPALLGLVAFASALVMLFWIVRRCYLPAGFLSSFLTVYLVVFGASALVTAIMPESYLSMTRIEIQRNAAQPSSPNLAPRVSGFYDPYFIQTEFEVIQSDVVLGKVIRDLDLENKWGQRYGRGQRLKPQEVLGLLKMHMDLRPVRSSNLIEIRVFSEIPEEAAVIANKIAEDYQAYEQSTFGATTASPVSVQIVDVANPGPRPVRPNKAMNLAIGALAGLLLGTIAGNTVSNRRARNNRA
jgi:capsular polysaccharide biosynthesis protein/tRNA A-37 threonylcarbamoyl transferase component Bud32